MRNILRKFGIDLVRYPYYQAHAEQKNYQKLLDYYKIDLIFDVGANIGQYAQEVFDFGYQGKLVSFEPMSKEHDIILQKSKNNINWDVAPRMAIGEKEGLVQFNVSENSVSSSILEANDYVLEFDPEIKYIKKENVTLRSMNNLYAEYSIGFNNIFLKLDVQGYEASVLEGAAKVLHNFKGIHLEFSLNPLYHGEKGLFEMLKLIEPYGFKPHYFMPHPSVDKIGRLMQIDGVFYK